MKVSVIVKIIYLFFVESALGSGKIAQIPFGIEYKFKNMSML
jgi:hypothetical protein